ncbi:MAG TPA: nitroreductase [Clostridiales bacterium]|nr:nitroreductase [Clostridiales bacterium]
MNEVLQCIKTRYTCRAYDGKLPERQTLTQVAQAAAEAPSAMNRQPWQIVVIADKQLIGRMDDAGMNALKQAKDKAVYNRFMERGGRLFYNAPCMFLVLMRQGMGLDTGIVSENIALAAHSLGLGSTICGMAALPFECAEGRAFKEEIGIEQDWEFGIAVLVGQPAKTGAPHQPDAGKIRFVEGE